MSPTFTKAVVGEVPIKLHPSGLSAILGNIINLS